MRASQPFFAKEFLPVALSKKVLGPLLALRVGIHPLHRPQQGKFIPEKKDAFSKSW